MILVLSPNVLILLRPMQRAWYPQLQLRGVRVAGSNSVPVHVHLAHITIQDRVSSIILGYGEAGFTSLIMIMT